MMFVCRELCLSTLCGRFHFIEFACINNIYLWFVLYQFILFWSDDSNSDEDDEDDNGNDDDNDDDDDDDRNSKNSVRRSYNLRENKPRTQLYHAPIEGL